MNNPFARPLTGCVVGLSVSESDDSVSCGFPEWQVNRVTLQIVEALFSQGVTVAFGHDWRDDGVMEAIHGFARRTQPPMPFKTEGSNATGQPLLWNLIPWPDKPYLPEKDLERLTSTLQVESAGLPEELAPVGYQALQKGQQSEAYRYLRARALTHLRQKLNSLTHARICVGGRCHGSAGRYPGVIEEALIAVQTNRPLFIAGFLGGASKEVATALTGGTMPQDFCHTSNEMNSLFGTPPFFESNQATVADRIIDRNLVWSMFAKMGIPGLAKWNRLTPMENEELLHTPVLDRVIQLILTGLSRLHRK